MRNVVLHCPWLGRKLTTLRARIPDLQVFIGAHAATPEDGCLQSHQAIIKEALFLDEPSIFVMEDDCEFTRHFAYETWLEDVGWAEAMGYDILAGGCTRTYGERVVRPGQEGVSTILEVSAFHSAHCVVYFRSGFEKVANAIQPYDVSLGRDCGMRCALVHPFVAVQRPSFSGILRTNVDYVPLYNAHQYRLEQAIRRASMGSQLEMETY